VTMSRYEGDCRSCNRRCVLWLRSVCRPCYHRRRQSVRAGTTTWLILEAEGLVSPPRRVGIFQLRRDNHHAP
jgi:hypothetical protein